MLPPVAQESYVRAWERGELYFVEGAEDCREIERMMRQGHSTLCAVCLSINCEYSRIHYNHER